MSLLNTSVRCPPFSATIGHSPCRFGRNCAWCASSSIVPSRLSTHQQRMVMQTLKLILSKKNTRMICSLYTLMLRNVKYHNFSKIVPRPYQTLRKATKFLFGLGSYGIAHVTLYLVINLFSSSRNGASCLFASLDAKVNHSSLTAKNRTGHKVLKTPDCDTLVH